MKNLTLFLLATLLHIGMAVIPTTQQIDDIVKEITDRLDNGDDPADYLRLAWHDSATFNMSLPEGMAGGNHASMRLDFDAKAVPKTNEFEGGDLNNAGQDEAIEELENIRSKFRSVISTADLWVLAANTAIEWAGGPHIVTRFGRLDASLPEDGIETFEGGPLPDEEQNPNDDDDRDTRELNELDYLLDFFDKFGFDDTKHALAALVGGHTLGKCEPQNSGLNGPWTQNAIKFDNSFYRILTQNELTEQEINNTALDNEPFGIAHQLNTKTLDTDPGNTLMLYSDVAILRDDKMKDLAMQYAADEQLWFDDFAKYWGELMELAWKGELVEAGATVTESSADSSKKIDGKSLGVGFVVGFVIMLLFAVLYFCCCAKKKKDDQYTRMDEPQRRASELVGISDK